MADKKPDWEIILSHLDPHPLKLETNYLKKSRIFRTVHRLSPNREKVVYLIGGAVRDSLLVKGTFLEL